MKNLYSNPLRVYLLLAVLAAIGVFSGLSLPISLFPNSSKPSGNMSIPYAGLSAEDFRREHGNSIEWKLRALKTESVKVEEVKTNYGTTSVSYDIEFTWGSSNDDARRELESVLSNATASMPEEARRNASTWSGGGNRGFYAASFYSDSRNLDDVYELLRTTLVPRLSQVPDANNPGIWNPNQKEIRVELSPELMASLQLFPKDIEGAVRAALRGTNAGAVTLNSQSMSVEFKSGASSLEELGRIPLRTPSGRLIHLNDIAHIDFGPLSTGNRSFKTSGAPSVILFAMPKPGSNIKRMAEDVQKAIDDVMATLPKDIHFRVLVDPSEFIRSAVNNVFHEVAIGALLAVAILFFFIGSFKNVVTAAIEIPLSLVLAFILMKMSGMNLNLISLGGLALSAGMNVDASVVVMENIFRHFDEHGKPKTFAERVHVLVNAVREVRFAVISSTIASLVVFLPLAFTSSLTYAILGDLAKAVVFSHGFSAFVALLLVPTIRLQLMSGEKGQKAHKSPIEPFILWLENTYAKLLARFLEMPKLRLASYVVLASVLAALVVFVTPRLKKELIGKPDTDWFYISISSPLNTHTRQMENAAEKVERSILDKFGDKVSYTFNQIHSADNAGLMVRLKSKKDMLDMQKKLEDSLKDSPELFFGVFPWNPSEFDLPEPPVMKLVVSGGDIDDRAYVTQQISDLLQSNDVFERNWTNPGVERKKAIVLESNLEQWAALQSEGRGLSHGEIADLISVAASGKEIGQMSIAGRSTSINLRYPANYLESVEDLAALPIAVKGKIVPLKALSVVKVTDKLPNIHVENGKEVFQIFGNVKTGEEEKGDEALAKAKELVASWQREQEAQKKVKPGVTVTFEEADKELAESIDQLLVAVALSIGLIFITLVLQFSTIVEPLLVLVAIPTGLIGVLISLFIFKSTLSLNSVLGVILLNGISVANSIILVDFIKRLSRDGLAPELAACEAARKRLRPILITSLTTVLGMMPIAFGFGEGGRILQPLGIAVSGGLWISMLLTLFVVPALHVSYLRLSQKGQLRESRLSSKAIVGVVALFSLLVPTDTRAQVPAANFEDVVQKIVTESREVARAKTQSTLVKERNRPAHLAYYPTLSGQVGAQRGTVDRGLPPDDSLSAGINSNLNLYRFGADAASIRAADFEESAAETAVQDAILKVEGEAAKTLLEYIKATKELEVLSRIEKHETESFDIASLRYKRGLLALQEIQKLEIDRERSRARLDDAKTAVSIVEVRVANLSKGMRPHREWPWEKEKLEAKAAQIESQSSAASPEILALEQRLSARRADVEAARAKRYPSLDFDASYSHSRSLSQADGKRTPWQLGISLSVPLFDRFSAQSATHVAMENVTELRLEKEAAELRNGENLQIASLNFKNALASLRSREKALNGSRKLYQFSLERFEKGVLSVNDLSVDESRLYDAELLVLNAMQTVHQSFVELCHAKGQRLSLCLSL